jgi:hypothetical protein
MNMPELKGAGIAEAYAWWAKQEADGVDINALTMAISVDRLSARVVHQSNNVHCDIFIAGSDADQLLHQISAFVDCGYTQERVEKAVLYFRLENGDDRPIRTLTEVMHIANRLRDQRNVASAENRKQRR